MTRRGDTEDEPDQRAGELQVGCYHRHNPYDGLTDDEADILAEELRGRERRRVPFGFRKADR